MKTRSQRSIDDPIILAIISILIGVIASFLMIHFSKENKIVDIVGGMNATILTIIVGEMWRHRQLVPRLSSLERAAADDHLYRLLINQIDAIDEINQLRARYAQSSSFIAEKLEDAFNRLDDSLQRLRRGEIHIDSEERELTSNTDFLEQLPDKAVYAVSYQDEKFWEEPEGQKFLEAHEKVLKNDHVQISRIFIIPEAKIDSQRSSVLNQVGLGIECSIIVAESLEETSREDFVLYDQRYVRFAQLVARTATKTLKHATLTCEADKVREYADKYAYLEARSTDAKRFYNDRPTTQAR